MATRERAGWLQRLHTKLKRPKDRFRALRWGKEPSRPNRAELQWGWQPDGSYYCHASDRVLGQLSVAGFRTTTYWGSITKEHDVFWRALDRDTRFRIQVLDQFYPLNEAAELWMLTNLP